MRINATVILYPEDDAEEAKVIARLKGLGLVESSGDQDGRRWVQISGRVDAEGLSEIANCISR